MQRYCILLPRIGQGLDSTKTQRGRTCFSALVPDCVPYRFPISSCTLFASPVANTFLEAVKCTLLLSLVKHQELGVFQASECVCVTLAAKSKRNKSFESVRASIHYQGNVEGLCPFTCFSLEWSHIALSRMCAARTSFYSLLD